MILTVKNDNYVCIVVALREGCVKINLLENALLLEVIEFVSETILVNKSLQLKYFFKLKSVEFYKIGRN